MSVRPRGLEEARGVARFAAQGEAGLLTAHRLGGGWLATASAFALLPIDPVRFVFTRADGRSEPVFRQAPIAFVLGVGAAFGVE